MHSHLLGNHFAPGLTSIAFLYFFESILSDLHHRHVLHNNVRKMIVYNHELSDHPHLNPKAKMSPGQKRLINSVNPPDVYKLRIKDSF